MKDKVQELIPWYQNIELGHISTNPAEPDYPISRWRAIEPYVPEDLSGKSVLDLGCNAGFFSVKMKQRGASYVLGVDVSPKYIAQAKFVSRYLGLSIDYRVASVYEFLLANPQKFDYVIFLGLFYHLRHPLLVLDRVSEITVETMYFQTMIRGRTPATVSDPTLPFNERRLVLEDDYPISETLVFEHPDYPKMYFIEKKYNNDYSNWWVCNETCVYALLRSSGFRNIVKVGSDTFVCDASREQPRTMDWDRKVSRIPPISEWQVRRTRLRKFTGLSTRKR